MPIDNTEKELVLSHKNKPIVGLIHKVHKTVIFAPCIPEKVFLKLNESGQAISGSVVNDLSTSDSAMNDEQLSDVNALLNSGHVPRYAYTWSSPECVKSSHELLFKQKCKTNDKSNWEGLPCN